MYAHRHLHKGISNIVETVFATGSTALADKLKELEADKKIYENALFDKEKELDKMTVDKKEMKRAFKKAKNMLMSGTLTNRKAIVENYVKQIIIYKDKITVEFNVIDNYSVIEENNKIREKYFDTYSSGCSCLSCIFCRS